MAWKYKFQIEGDKDVMAAFSVLADAMQRKIQRTAVLKAARIVAKAAKANAPRETGLLRKSIGSKVVTYPKQNLVIGIVGPRRDVKGKAPVFRRKTVLGKRGKARVARPGEAATGVRNPVNYAHLVEEGRGVVDVSKERVRRLRPAKTRRRTTTPLKPYKKVLYSPETGKFLGIRVRAAQGTHFLARAVASTQSAVRSLLASEIRAGMDKEAARARKRRDK